MSIPARKGINGSSKTKQSKTTLHNKETTKAGATERGKKGVKIQRKLQEIIPYQKLYLKRHGN